MKIAPSNGVYPPRVLHGGVFGGTPLGSPEMYIFARARMGVCTESCQFVVPLGPAPPPPVRTRAESAPKNGTWNFGKIKKFSLCIKIFSYIQLAYLVLVLVFVAFLSV